MAAFKSLFLISSFSFCSFFATRKCVSVSQRACVWLLVNFFLCLCFVLRYGRPRSSWPTFRPHVRGPILQFIQERREKINYAVTEYSSTSSSRWKWWGWPQNSINRQIYYTQLRKGKFFFLSKSILLTYFPLLHLFLQKAYKTLFFSHFNFCHY